MKKIKEKKKRREETEVPEKKAVKEGDVVEDEKEKKRKFISVRSMRKFSKWVAHSQFERISSHF